MARLTNFAIFLVVLQVVMLMFWGGAQIPNSQALTVGNYTLSTNAFWDVATNVQNWNSLAFFQVIGLIAVGIAATGILIGAILGLKTDFMVFAIMIPALISLGFPIANFAMLLNAGLSSLFCPGAATSTCMAAVPFNIIIAGSMALYYVFCILDWWRGK